jgi:hypothetical protein
VNTGPQPDPWMTRHNRETTTVLELQSRQLQDDAGHPGGAAACFWGPPGGPAHHGVVSGPGFQALASEFPPGTRLTVTARITLPDPTQEDTSAMNHTTTGTMRRLLDDPRRGEDPL